VGPSKETNQIGGSDSYFLISVTSGVGPSSPIPNSLVAHFLASQKLHIGSS